ncbi:MAG: helix-turn-helix domain-containing protein [Methyloceanibacter sp.]|uniref:helix-turn-helix domain-containing protein n=1 Tax=Methyloceanibacter sp. TaxID=1965321 RepID=UPI003D9B256B
MGILALIAEFENDIRRERQMDGIKKARERGVRFGRKPLLVVETIKQVKNLRKTGKTVPEIMHQMNLSKASVYRALGTEKAARANQGLHRRYLWQRLMSALRGIADEFAEALHVADVPKPTSPECRGHCRAFL